MGPESYMLGFIDVETTGHDPIKRVGGNLVMWHEIIEMALVIADSSDLDIKAAIDFRVKPEHPERCLDDLVNDYPKRALAGEWNKAVPLESALREFFLQFLKSYNVMLIPVGQNFFFDWSFLSVAFAWYGIMEKDWGANLHYSKLDTRSMAVQELLEPGMQYKPSEYSLRNEVLAKRLGIPMETYPHTARNGARQAYLVYKKLHEIKKTRLQEVKDGLR